MLSNSRFIYVMLDISRDEVARYIVEDDDALSARTSLIEKHPHRFLFGTDTVAPAEWDRYAKTYEIYQPLWHRLKTESRPQVLRLNYERVFDAAVPRVKAWERIQLSKIADPT